MMKGFVCFLNLTVSVFLTYFNGFKSNCCFNFFNAWFFVASKEDDDQSGTQLGSQAYAPIEDLSDEDGQ